MSRANSSTGSLPGTVRLTNGSSLKQSTAAPPHVDDPVDVLEKIIGEPLKRSGGDDDGEEAILERPRELLEDVDFGGLGLQEFASSESKHESTMNVKATQESIQSVEECEYVHLCATIIRSGLSERYR